MDSTVSGGAAGGNEDARDGCGDYAAGSIIEAAGAPGADDAAIATPANTPMAAINTLATTPMAANNTPANTLLAVINLPAITLMGLNNNVLAKMFRPLTLEHASLAYFTWVKLINKRMTTVIRDEMKNKDYQKAVHAFVFLVPGTRIPCGTATVLPVPIPGDWDETMEIFDESKLAPNGVEVGGIFGYHAMFFTETEELEESDSGLQEFLLLLQLDFWGRDIYDPALESEGPADVADLQFLPDNLRSAMGHLGLTVSYDSLERTDMGDYLRFLRVRADTTMQQVYDAVSFAEGWTMPEFNMRIADTEIAADVTVLASSEMLDDEQWRLCINWPKLSIKIGHVSVDVPYTQPHTTIDMQQGPVSESGDSDAERAVDGNAIQDSEMPSAPDANCQGELKYDVTTGQWTYANIP